jgi:hypothetical protein
MPTYLLEVYVSNVESVPQASDAARRVADADDVRYVRTTFLREDETCFHVFEAPSRDALVDAAEHAGLTDVRVTEAIEDEDDRRRLRHVTGSRKEKR